VQPDSNSKKASAPIKAIKPTDELQQTWLRQGGKRRENLRLNRVKSTSGAKTPSR